MKPLDVDTFDQVEECYEQGNYEKTFSLIKAMIEDSGQKNDHPNVVGLKLGLVDLYVRHEYVNDAESLYIELLETDIKDLNQKLRVYFGYGRFSFYNLKNYKNTFHFFSKALKIYSNNEEEQMILHHAMGLCYYNGYGVEKNNALAKFHFLEAIKRGHIGSQINLSFLKIKDGYLLSGFLSFIKSRWIVHNELKRDRTSNKVHLGMLEVI